MSRLPEGQETQSVWSVQIEGFEIRWKPSFQAGESSRNWKFPCALSTNCGSRSVRLSVNVTPGLALAIPALYAATVEERVAGVFLEDAPDHHTSETALFRILRYADVPQSAALLFPRSVFFSGTRAPGFAWTDEVYRVLGQPGRCTTSAESPAKNVAHKPDLTVIQSPAALQERIATSRRPNCSMITVVLPATRPPVLSGATNRGRSDTPAE